MAIEIKIKDVTYPCRPTMGAMLRFKQMTGKEVSEIGVDAFSEMSIYLYCCVASACNADDVEFDYDLEKFADSVSPETLTEWAVSMQTKSTSDTKKA